MSNYDNDAREIIIDELMTLISDIRNGATIHKFRLDKEPHSYILHASIIPKPLPKYEYEYLKQAMGDIPMSIRELEEKGNKKKTKKDYVDCHNCNHHNYDTLFGGDDEYEICEKGHELFPKECKDFKEL